MQLPKDRVTQLRVSELRGVGTIQLATSGLVVLVGNTGVGKSMLVEAFELLRWASQPDYIRQLLINGHGGVAGLAQNPERPFSLGVTISGPGPQLTYDISLRRIGSRSVVHGEHLFEEGRLVFSRSYNQTRPLSFGRTQGHKDSPTDLTLAHLQQSEEAARRTAAALSAIQPFGRFATFPLWYLHKLRVRGPYRLGTVARPTDSSRLDHLATNLAAVYKHLRTAGEEVWQRILGRIRLGLGADVLDVCLQPGINDVDTLAIVYRREPPVPVVASRLSEGQLAYLAHVALAEVSPRHSLLALDNPESCLAPSLIPHVVRMLETIAVDTPVVVATHSLTFLESLTSPENSIIVCESAGGGMSLRCPTSQELHQLDARRAVGTPFSDALGSRSPPNE